MSMPGGWKDYWVKAQGEYLLSNEAGYDPNGGSNVSWKRMDRFDPGAR